MKVTTVDGRPLMLNNRESQYWIDTGQFTRIPEGDQEDPEYCSMRDKMKANGDEQYYQAICPK